jgi:Leucine-rich repeat (LRR) protein
LEIDRDENIPKQELNALQALFNATDGVHWSWPPADRNQTGVPWVFAPDANPCVDNWYGIKCTDSLPRHVESIILPSQNLSGTLPEELGDFPVLHKLEFRHNPKLTGTIPDIFGNLTILQGLDMSHNSLNGTLPPSLLSTASTLESLVVYRNLLTGPFPMFLCNLTMLLELNIANNSMNGTLPDCIGQLTNIHGVTVSENNFTGTIPQTLGAMVNLHEISFDTNTFTGTIPASVGNLPHLKYLGLFFTNLSGHIPDSICGLQNLKGLFVFNSHFSGTIPYCMGNITRLDTFEGNYNHFTGTIPQGVLSKVHMQNFAVRNSALSDMLPSDLSPSLQTLEFGDNALYGTLPDALFSISGLKVIELYGNHITGSLPSSVKSNNLYTLDVSQNYVTGTLPTDIGNCSLLGYLLLSQNMLTGTLPSSSADLRLLQEFDVSSNKLGGSLVHIFDSESQIRLKTVLVNDNHFTGQIPDDLFRLRALTVFVAVSNCFYTELTDAMCSSESIVTLAMDGLRAGAACRQYLLHGLSNAYTVRHALPQQIPTCLFQMKTLTTLHLSGNVLTGTLPNNVTISETLTGLTLSHNKLDGTIPRNFQSKQWDALDLSYNRLTGTLLSSFDNTTAAKGDLSLENNRISGKIPHVLLKASKISILGSNIFDCNNQRTNLPEHDSGRANYHCASKSFDIPYYIWLVLLAILLAVCSLIASNGHTLQLGARLHTIRERINFAVDSLRACEQTKLTSSLTIVIAMYTRVYQIAWICTGYMILVLVPFYVAASRIFGTFDHQYAWQVSAALLSGTTVTYALMGLWIALLGLFLSARYVLERRSRGSDLVPIVSTNRPNSTSSNVSSTTVLLSWFDRCCVYALFMTVSVSVVAGVNIAYVFVVLRRDSSVVVVVQILLAFFKLFWNSVCSKLLMHWAGRQVSKFVEATESTYGSEFHFVQLFVSLINNIAIPCIVVAVISPNCLYNVFVPAPIVSANYEYQKCAGNNLFDGRCLDHYDTLVGEASYNPPFVYSYQCSSSIVTYYAPAFVFLCITATFVTPLSQFIALRTARAEWVPQRIQSALQLCVPKILLPINTAAESQPSRLYFDANRAAILLFSYCGMLMTFGAVFPPLAVALAVTVLSTSFFIKLKIGNFVGGAQAVKAGQLIEELDLECKQLAQMDVLGPSVWLIVTFSCWFYTLFLFDTLGDAVGLHRAYWVLIVMPLMPLCLYIVYSVVAWYLEKDNLKQVESDLDTTVSPLGGEASTTVHVELRDIYSRPSECV